MRRHRINALVATALLACTIFAVASIRATNPGQNTSNSTLIAKLRAARKTAVGQPLVINGKEVCGPTGDSTDANIKELDNNKNRTDEPGQSEYIAVDWDAVKDLPADKVSDIQGAPVQVTGFLSHQVKVENAHPKPPKKGGESTNCHLTQDDEVDWHMYLTKNPNETSIANAVIVETTPRVRPNHKWTAAQLRATYLNKNKPLRISGWLLYDLEHLDVVGKERATVWEVHPVTMIEAQDAQGHWVNIEH
jgi:hypothetical protein